ncbi:MAG: ATP-binding protein [Alphaproteobacteria bacterium]
MLRTKLLLAIATSLAVVFTMAALLYWGPGQMARQLDRSLLAHGQTEGYLRLSGDTYRHFWQLADRLIAAKTEERDGHSTSRERIREQLEMLERLIIEELGFLGGSEPQEHQELLRVRQLADAIAASVVAFNHVREQEAGTPGRAEQLDLLSRKIDRDFAGLIDEAIADEREETLEADERVRRMASWLGSSAAVLSILGALLVGGLGCWLLRSISGPIEQLLLGTQRIASGDLGHRIRLQGRDELAHLASSFNGMAEDLEHQRSALMQAQAGLEEKVRERTRELEQANLTLKRLDEVRRRMFADISHELRTPLTIISGEAEVTLRSKDAGEAGYRTALGRIVDLTGQVARLVDDLMVLARSDTAELQVRRRPVVAIEVVRDALEDLRALAGSKEIEVRLHMPDELDAAIDADASRIAQLLLILVDNACRYSEAGTRIDLSLRQEGGEVLIRVTDQGIGIPAADLGAVFDRYFRGERARHLAQRGAGLGLHVAKTIAEAHGGRLLIDSVPDVGTTVTLALPLHQPGGNGDAHSSD